MNINKNVVTCHYWVGLKKLPFSLLICLLSVSVLYSQEASRVTISKFKEDIKLDGIPNEAVWQKIEPFPLTSHWPNHGLPPGKKTEFRIFYTNDYLYVSVICYEDPENIQQSSFQRDGNWNLQSDQVALTLDTYDDAENAVMFIVSPSGARTDQTIRNDAISGAFFNDSWNTFWEAEVNLFDRGWQTEIKIPFSILRFSSNDGLTKMGLSFYRYSAHDKKLDVYPAISNEFGFFSFSKPSLSQDVVFENIKNENPLYFTPFILGSRSTISELNEQETGYKSSKNNDFSAGFSAQYGITSNINVDVSFNTDFAQVEADNQVVNLTRFSLYFPEKRRFFQERSSTFEFNNDGNNKLFYSRRIGLKDGEIVPLWGGLRVVGRSGKTDFGVLTMQSKETSAYTSENYAVARFRRDIINQNSYIGGMMTSVLSAGGNFNLGYGLDALINMTGDEYLKVSLAQTSSNVDSMGSGIDRSRIFVEWEKRKNVGFGYRFNFGQVGDQYRPALGFENRFDYWRLGDRLFYNIWMPEESSLQRIDFTVDANTFVNRTTENIESVNFNPNIAISGKNEFSLEAGINVFYDNPLDTFYISDDVYIPPSSYMNRTMEFFYQSPAVRLLNMGIGYSYGGFYGGIIHSPSAFIGYLPSKYFQFSLESEYNNIQIPKFETFDFTVSRFIVTCTFNVKWTVSTFAQYNSAQDLWAMNSRLRYNPRDGINLFVVFNGFFNSDRSRVLPELPTTDNSLFVIKYSHTFIL